MEIPPAVAALGAPPGSIRDAWQRGDAGTEQLRVALRQYRTFWNRLEDFSREV